MKKPPRSVVVYRHPSSSQTNILDALSPAGYTITGGSVGKEVTEVNDDGSRYTRRHRVCPALVAVTAVQTSPSFAVEVIVRGPVEPNWETHILTKTDLREMSGLTMARLFRQHLLYPPDQLNNPQTRKSVREYLDAAAAHCVHRGVLAPEPLR